MEPRHIISHIPYFPWPQGTFGIQQAITIFVDSATEQVGGGRETPTPTVQCRRHVTRPLPTDNNFYSFFYSFYTPDLAYAQPQHRAHSKLPRSATGPTPPLRPSPQLHVHLRRRRQPQAFPRSSGHGHTNGQKEHIWRVRPGYCRKEPRMHCAARMHCTAPCTPYGPTTILHGSLVPVPFPASDPRPRPVAEPRYRLMTHCPRSTRPAPCRERGRVVSIASSSAPPRPSPTSSSGDVSHLDAHRELVGARPDLRPDPAHASAPTQQAGTSAA
ncbi:hypothetical protein B0H10DRAFT_2223872 [Mycena sp. CBHHK59/15]|nr:hypothetical protein B0H10DRAFT_2223872 [Mycena sp. CBHHK59/15]